MSVVDAVALARQRSSLRPHELPYLADGRHEPSPQWWQAMRSQQRAATMALWVSELFGPAATAAPLALAKEKHGELPGQSQELMQRKLSEYAVVTGCPPRLSNINARPESPPI